MFSNRSVFSGFGSRFDALGRLMQRAVILLTVFAGVRVLLGFLGQDLWYDEAYTLQGVDSLVGERRYATFGVIRGFGPWDFDPNLTTGPAVTVPLAPVWWLTSGSLVAVRLVMLAVFVGYCAGVIRLAREVTASWVLSALALLPALIIAPEHLGFALGELPGATFIVWALVLSSRARYGWAGLLLGLAVQSKLAFAPMVAVIAAVMVLQAFRRREWLSAVRIPLMVALPTLVFETWRFWTFGGLAGYRRSIDEARSYIADQNLNLYGHWTDNDAHWNKIENFVGLLPGVGWVLFGSSLLVAVLVVARASLQQLKVLSRFARTHVPKVDIPRLAPMVGGIVVFVGWLTQSRQLGARQVVGVFLVCAPLVLIEGRRALASITHGSRRMLLGLGAVLAVLLAVQPVRSEWTVDVDPVSERQREVIRIIKDNGATSLLADGFWQYPEYQLLTRVPAVQRVEPMGQLAIFGVAPRKYPVFLQGEPEDHCDVILLEEPDVTVCEPRVPSYEELAGVRIVSWGEQDARLGETSNQQPNGYGGLWFVLEPEDPVALRALQGFIEGTQIEVGEISADGTVITAFVPPAIYRTPGRHVIELRNAITGEIIPVGEFTL